MVVVAMEDRDVHSQWGPPLVDGSWSWQAEENAGYSIDSVCYSAYNPHVNQSASASIGRPSYDMNSDMLTHNIKLSITTTRGGNSKSSVPDGSALVKYQEPDAESFIFDQKKGFRFDPTTGLHYDANSGYFINCKLGILLRWDPLFSTYIRAGDLSILRPDMDPESSSGNSHNIKRVHIGRSISRSNSGSPVRPRTNSSGICIGRSRSRSVSSGRQPRGRQPRSRSAGRGRKRYRSRSPSDSKNPSKSRRSRSRSVSRRRKCCRSASRSPSGTEQPIRNISKGSKSRTAFVNSASRKICSRSPVSEKRKYKSTPITKNTKLRDEIERSHLGESVKKGDVWKRLGPKSPTRQISGSVNPVDDALTNSRRVHLVHAFDCGTNEIGDSPVSFVDDGVIGEDEFQEDLSDGEIYEDEVPRYKESKATKVDLSKNNVDIAANSAQVNTGALVNKQTQEIGKSRSFNSRKSREKEALYVKEEFLGGCPEVASFEKARASMKGNDSREQNHSEAIKEEKSNSSKGVRSNSKVFARGKEGEPRRHDISMSRTSQSNQSKGPISSSRRSHSRESENCHSRVGGKPRGREHRRSYSRSPPLVKREPWCCSSRRRNESGSMESSWSFPLSPSSVRREPCSGSGNTEGYGGSNSRGIRRESYERVSYGKPHRIQNSRDSSPEWVNTRILRKSRRSRSPVARKDYNGLIRIHHIRVTKRSPRRMLRSACDRENRRSVSRSPGRLKKEHQYCSIYMKDRSCSSDSRRFSRSPSPTKRESRSRSGSFHRRNTFNSVWRDRSLSRGARKTAYESMRRNSCREPSRSPRRAWSPDRVNSRSRENRKSYSRSPVYRRVERGRSCSGSHQRRCSCCSPKRWRCHSRDTYTTFSISSDSVKMEPESQDASIRRSNDKAGISDNKQPDRSLSTVTQRKKDLEETPVWERKKSPCPSPNNQVSSSALDEPVAILIEEPTPKTDASCPTEQNQAETPVWEMKTTDCSIEINKNSCSASDESIIILEDEPPPTIVSPEEQILAESPVSEIKISCSWSVNVQDSPSTPDKPVIIVDDVPTTTAETVHPRESILEKTILSVKMSQCSVAVKGDSSSTPDKSSIVILDEDPTPRSVMSDQRELIPDDASVGKMVKSQCLSSSNLDSSSPPDESIIIHKEESTPTTGAVTEKIQEGKSALEIKFSQRLCASNLDLSSMPDESTHILKESAPTTGVADPAEQIQEENPVLKMKSSQCLSASNLDSSSTPDESTIILEEESTPTNRASSPTEQTQEKKPPFLKMKPSRSYSIVDPDSSSLPNKSKTIIDKKPTPKSVTTDRREKIVDNQDSKLRAAKIILKERILEAEAANPKQETPFLKMKLSPGHSAVNQDSSSLSDKSKVIMNKKPTPKIVAPVRRGKVLGKQNSTPDVAKIVDQNQTPKSGASDERKQVEGNQNYTPGEPIITDENRSPKTAPVRRERNPVVEIKTSQFHSANNMNSSSTPHESEAIIILDDELPLKAEVPAHIEQPPKDNPVDTVVDNGDVLSHLFINHRQTLTNILLVAPVPLHKTSINTIAALKKQIGEPKDLLKIYVSYQNASGSTCPFMMISFKSAKAAKLWYNSLGGTIVLCGDDGSKLKGYLHFLKKGNWNCKHCKSFNFFVQSLCSKCYKAKDNRFSPVAVSAEPTAWVGIAGLGGKFSTTEKVIDSLPSLADFKIWNVEMISEPSGLPLGLCVFEVEDAEQGAKLLEFFHEQEKKAMFLVMNEEPKSHDEQYLSLLFDKVKPSNILIVAVIPLVSIPDMKFELLGLEVHLSTLLKEDGVRYELISSHIGGNVGSPYSYVLITFADSEKAARWFRLCRRTFNNSLGPRQSFNFRTSKQRSILALHFSEDNWECHGCRAINFPLRSLCHRCFQLKEPNRFGLVSQSLTPTRWLAVPEFSDWSKGDEQIVADFRELTKEFILKKIEVLRDPERQSLPLACVIEMQGKGESLHLKEYLNREGWCSVFVVVHKELDGLLSRDDSSIPDVVVVEAPPPECIDLTNERTTSSPQNGDSTADSLETSTTDHPLMNPEKEHDPAQTVDPTLSSEATAPECTPREANPSQLEGIAESASFPDVAPSLIDQPPSVNETNKSDHTAVEIANSSSDMARPASMDAATNVQQLKPAGKATKNKKNPRNRKAPRPHKMAQSSVLFVGPVSWLGENTQWLYALAFLNYGAKYESVQFCQGDSFGVPYNYCLVFFESPQSAKQWLDMERRGFIKITNRSFPNVEVESFKPIKAFLHFSGRNWQCACGRENFWKRSLCHRCYQHKNRKNATFTPTRTPTKFLAVKLLKWYPAAELATIFPKARCEMCNVVTVKFVSDPSVKKDKFGVYIFETTSVEGAITLLSYYKRSLVVHSSSFVLLKDYCAGVAVDLGLAALSAVDDVGLNADSMIAQACMLGGKPKPDYEAIIWTSFFGFHLNKPTTNVVMVSLCLEYRELPDETRTQIQDSLQEAGVTSQSIDFSFKRDVGSPFSYCLVSFETLDFAKRWFDKCSDDTFQFEVSCPDDEKIPHRIQDCYTQKMSSNGDLSYLIKSKLHYSSPNWLCACGTSNFPLRSLCHSCFKNKHKGSGYSVPSATKYVAIKLTEYLETVDTSALYDVRPLGFKVSKINIGSDPAVPRDPYGIVIFEMQSVNEGIKFHQFLTDLSVSGRTGRIKYYHSLIKNLKAVLDISSEIIFFRCQS